MIWRKTYRESVIQKYSVICEIAKIFSVKRDLPKVLPWISDPDKRVLKIYHFLTWIRIWNQWFIKCLLGCTHAQKNNSHSQRCKTQTSTRKQNAHDGSSWCCLAWVMTSITKHWCNHKGPTKIVGLPGPSLRTGRIRSKSETSAQQMPSNHVANAQPLYCYFVSLSIKKKPPWYILIIYWTLAGHLLGNMTNMNTEG